jgi:hypothetical protein
MGWFRKEDESKVPEKYRNLTPEQLVAAIEKAETLEKDTTELKAALAEKDTKIAEHSSELQKVQDQLKNLEMNRNKQPDTSKTGDDTIEFLQDPEGAMKQQISRSVAPVAGVVLNTNAQLARMGAKQTLDRLRIPNTKISKGAMFDKYSKDIDELAKRTNVSQLQTPDSWIYLFNMVIGSHMDEILSGARDGKTEEMFVEPSASQVDRTEDKREDKPTEEEIRIAKRMKIPVEAYMKQKKEMTFA